MYRQITLEHVRKTLKQLTKRINERFPESSLAAVGQEIQSTCEESTQKLAQITQPNYKLRVLSGLTIVIGLSVVTYSLLQIDLSVSQFRTSEIVSISETLINELILISAALFFVFTLEARVKRARALKSINELRALSHVIDMHQLTKDPIEIERSNNTLSSPERTLTTFELNRYLDYCSELLSIIGKLAVIYGQSFPEKELTAAVNDIENLTNALSRKIWQKINILQIQQGQKLANTKT